MSCLLCLSSIKEAQGQLISTIAGNRYGNTLPATNARLSSPTVITFDAAGNLYIADRQNYRLRKVTLATGIITTIAGTGSGTSTGNGATATAASLNTPKAFAWMESEASTSLRRMYIFYEK